MLIAYSRYFYLVFNFPGFSMIYGYLVILIFIFECIAKKIRCNLIKETFKLLYAAFGYQIGISTSIYFVHETWNWWFKAHKKFVLKNKYICKHINWHHICKKNQTFRPEGIFDSVPKDLVINCMRWGCFKQFARI